MSPTTDAPRGRAPKPAVALNRIGSEPAPLELKVRLSGEAAAAFKDYQRAYQAAHGETPEAGALAAQLIAAFISADRGFAIWRKAHPDGRAE